MMKKLLYVSIALCVLVMIVGCGANASNNSALPNQETSKEETNGAAGETALKDNNSETAKIPTPNDQTDLLEAIKAAYEFPFKLWGPEGMELYCIYIYEDHAKRDWSSDSEQTCHDHLSWNVSGDQLNISGTWTESFTIDLAAETATSVESGKVYRIVKGQSQ